MICNRIVQLFFETGILFFFFQIMFTVQYASSVGFRYMPFLIKNREVRK